MDYADSTFRIFNSSLQLIKGTKIKMLENRPEDALVKLVKTVENVKTVEIVETVETVETVGL